MWTTVGCATNSFSSLEAPVTAELKKEKPLHSPSPTPSPTSNFATTSLGTKIDVSTIPSPPLKMSGCDDNSTDNVVITKVTKLPSSLPDKEQAEFPIKVMVLPDYYVPIDSRSIKPGLFKSRGDGNSVCLNMYSSLAEERKRTQETPIAGVHISKSDRVKGWDPTDIISLLPTSHKLSDSLLSKFFRMIEEEAVKQGKRVHTCNMEVL